MSEFEHLTATEKYLIRHLAELQAGGIKGIIESEISEYLSTKNAQDELKSAISVLENLGVIARQTNPHGKKLSQISSVTHPLRYNVCSTHKNDWDKDPPYVIKNAILVQRRLDDPLSANDDTRSSLDTGAAQPTDNRKALSCKAAFVDALAEQKSEKLMLLAIESDDEGKTQLPGMPGGALHRLSDLTLRAGEDERVVALLLWSTGHSAVGCFDQWLELARRSGAEVLAGQWLPGIETPGDAATIWAASVAATLWNTKSKISTEFPHVFQFYAYAASVETWNHLCHICSAASIEEASESTLNKPRRENVTATSKDKRTHKLTPFTGGTMVFFSDRIELCGADICSGSRSELRHKLLNLLRKRNKDDQFVSYSGKQLAAKLNHKAGRTGIAGIIRGLRKRIRKALREHAGIECSTGDVIQSGGLGYRLSEKLSVQEGGNIGRVCKQGQNVKHIKQVDTVNDPDHDPVNDTDDPVKARRMWIIHEVGKGRELRAPLMAKELKCSLPTVKRLLKTLKNEGKIEYVGSSRKGYYRLSQLPASNE